MKNSIAALLVLLLIIQLNPTLAQGADQSSAETNQILVWAISESGYNNRYYCPGSEYYGKPVKGYSGEYVTEDQALAAGYKNDKDYYDRCGMVPEIRAECANGRYIFFFLQREKDQIVGVKPCRSTNLNECYGGYQTPGREGWACLAIKLASQRHDDGWHGGCRTSDFSEPVKAWHPSDITSICDLQQSQNSVNEASKLARARKTSECQNAKKRWGQLNNDNATIIGLQEKAQLEVAAAMYGCGSLKEAW